MKATRLACLVVGLAALACSDSGGKDPKTAAQADKVVRPVLNFGPDLISKRARDLALSELERRSPPDDPKDDPPWLEEYLAVSALFDSDPEEVPSVAKTVDSTPGSDTTVFCGLQTREHQLWLHSRGEGDLYTVKSKDGEALAVGIDDDELFRSFPKLHGMVHNPIFGF